MSIAIDIQGLHKTYPDGFVALKGIDLKIQSGDFFALLGPNGAGKSTTIGILCSLINKSSGKIKVYDADIDTDFPLAKSYLGIVPQEVNFNVFEHPMQIVMQQAGYYGLAPDVAAKRAEKYLQQLGLWEKRFTVSRTLSGGEKRRLMIARALVHHPKVLILDEPTAGVDLEIRHTMWAFLKEMNAAGTTIVLTTHYLEEAENLCRNIAIINKGNVVHHSSMQQLLRGLQKETYVLDIEGTPPIVENAPYTMRLEGNSLEVDLPRGDTLNDVFAWFDKQQIKVISMRSKLNRLEQLFVNLVGEAAA